MSDDIGKPEAYGLNRAAQHCRLQMHRNQWHAQFLLCDARTKSSGWRCNHSSSRLKSLFDDAVSEPHCREDQAPCNHRKRTDGMPKVRIQNRCIVLLFAQESNKIQTEAFCERPEYLRSYERYVVPSPAEGKSQPDIGMDIACTAKAEHDDAQRFHRYPITAAYARTILACQSSAITSGRMKPAFNPIHTSILGEINAVLKKMPSVFTMKDTGGLDLRAAKGLMARLNLLHRHAFS